MGIIEFIKSLTTTEGVGNKEDYEEIIKRCEYDELKNPLKAEVKYIESMQKTKSSSNIKEQVTKRTKSGFQTETKKPQEKSENLYEQER